MAAAGLAASSSNGAAAAVPGRSLRPKQPCRAAVKPSARATPRSCHVDQSAALFPAGGAMVGTASLAGSSSSSNSSSSSSRRSRTVIAAAAPSSHAAATGSSDTLSAAAATTAALLEWMQQQGCVVSGVALEYSQGPAGHVYRELKASQDLSPGDVLVSVPISCTIHYRDADIAAAAAATSSDGSRDASSSSSDGSSSSSDSRRASLRQLQGGVPAASDGSHGAWQFKMALEVLSHAMDPSSPLQPYIQTLPGACPGVPTPQVAMLWPAQQLQECQSAQLEADAGSQAYWLQQYSRDTLAQLPGSADDAFGGQTVTQERLGWALAVSMSRAFGFKRLGGHALAPLIDMANHAPVSNAEVRYSSESGRVNLVANKQVAAGDPILLHYGPHDNANLLLSYGFVLPDNSADRFRTALDIDTVLAAILQFVGGELPPTGRATDSLKQWQRTALQQLGLLPGGGADSSPAAAAAAAASSAAGEDGAAVADALQQQHQSQQQQEQSKEQQQLLMPICIGGQPPVSGPLLAAVRVVLSQERAAVKSRSLEQLGDWEQPLSAAHEALVMKALVGLATVLYKSFPTSIQQDRTALTALQQQQQQQQQEQDELLSRERQLAAVQFRLGQKLLLEASTKQLIARLQALAAQQ